MIHPKFLCVVCLLLLSMLPTAYAHEVRPSLLQITERTPGEFEILWKRPKTGNKVIRLTPVISSEAVGLTKNSLTGSNVTGIDQQAIDQHAISQQGINRPADVEKILANAHLLLWRKVKTDLRQQRIYIAGLDRTIADVLVNIRWLDGSHINHILKPESPSMLISDFAAIGQLPTAYFTLGISHILEGIDHLMLVFGLMLLIPSRWSLLKTITAFTVAHSITLAMMALQWLQPPSALIEALVALSIVIVAVEVLRFQRGNPGLSSRFPWLIAFAFGLLHGLAFGGELLNIGLPQQDILLSLLMFNLGIEAGQLLFIAVVITLGFVVTSVLNRKQAPITSILLDRGKWLPPYVIGSCAAFWFFERSVSAVGIIS